MEECDRCAPPKPAVYLVMKGEYILALCSACGQEHYPMLYANGWEFVPLTRTVNAPDPTVVDPARLNWNDTDPDHRPDRSDLPS